MDDGVVETRSCCANRSDDQWRTALLQPAITTNQGGRDYVSINFHRSFVFLRVMMMQVGEAAGPFWITVIKRTIISNA
jgi:hypothetical protein